MDLGQALLREAIAQVKKHFHEKIGSIRHPETGEFPTVIVMGDKLDDLRAPRITLCRAPDDCALSLIEQHVASNTRCEAG